MEMRQLSTREPYASYLRNGWKHFETKSYRTNYRGAIAIHASKTAMAIPEGMPELCTMFSGEIVAIADLTDCIEITPEFMATLSEMEIAAGFYSVGRYAWKLENIRPVAPIQHRGYPWLAKINLEV